MEASDLSQVVRLRRMRADKAARTLEAVRRKERAAHGEVAAARRALVDYDAHIEMRIAEFYRKAEAGLRPDELFSGRAFHADLIEKRRDYAQAITQAKQNAAAAAAAVAQARAHWAEKERAAEKLQEMRTDMALDAARALERRIENDGDDLSASRAGQGGG